MDAEHALNDLSDLTRDAEALLRETTGNLSEHAKAARSRLAAALNSAKATCERLQDRAVEGARVTDRTIRNHPYQSIGVAFGMGLLLGVLAIRRGND